MHWSVLEKRILVLLFITCFCVSCLSWFDVLHATTAILPLFVPELFLSKQDPPAHKCLVSEGQADVNPASAASPANQEGPIEGHRKQG